MRGPYPHARNRLDLQGLTDGTGLVMGSIHTLSRTDPMLAKRIAPLSMALLIAVSAGNAHAGKILSIAPSAAAESGPQKRQGVFKSIGVGFKAFREHRKAQG